MGCGGCGRSPHLSKKLKNLFFISCYNALMKRNNTGDRVYDLCIIGGGPSGMMAGVIAARKGLSVIILEKNDKVGNKLRITGGGRCNITNATFDNREFLDKFPEAKKFLFSPFSKFSAKDTFDFFEGSGLDLVTEARNRVFPKSQKALDVVKTLEKELRKNSVEIRTKSEVVDLRKTACDNEEEDCADGNREISSVILKSGDRVSSRNFVIATGGMASPHTGSTGDGFK
ncbi:MAG TPA: FAD-binding protein [Bacteroidia bacterium]|nr:FAD-binding protein [Bacteroidia bacterium]